MNKIFSWTEVIKQDYKLLTLSGENFQILGWYQTLWTNILQILCKSFFNVHYRRKKNLPNLWCHCGNCVLKLGGK